MPRFDDGAIGMREPLRRLAEQVVNAVMDAEADQLCGGGANSRNGYRERDLAICVGTPTPRIPKLRSGSFFGRLKIEFFYGCDWSKVTIEEFMGMLNAYLRWCRDARIKSDLDYRSPMQYRRDLGLLAA